MEAPLNDSSAASDQLDYQNCQSHQQQQVNQIATDAADQTQ